VPLNPDALTTVAKVQTRPGMAGVDGGRIEDSINAFSVAIKRYIRRQFKPTETGITKRFRYDGNGILDLGADDPPTELSLLTSITLYSDLPASSQLVLFAGDASSEADYRLEPRNKTEQGTYTWLVLPLADFRRASTSLTPIIGRVREAEVKIVGNWGAGVVPADVELACIREVTNDLRNPEGFSSRSAGDFAFVEDPSASWPLSRKTRQLLDSYRYPVIA